MINLLRENHGLFNVKVTFMPYHSSYRYALAEFAQKFLSNQELGKAVTVKSPDSLHMSLAYLLIPTEYVDDKDTEEKVTKFRRTIGSKVKKCSGLYLRTLVFSSQSPGTALNLWGNLLP